MLSRGRYTAAHLAWKYGLELIWSDRGAVLIEPGAGARREARWPDGPLTREIEELLTTPGPKRAPGATCSTRLDELERALLRPLGLDRDPVLRSRTFRVWLTHDIDQLRKTYQVATHLLRSIARRDPLRGAAELAWWVRERLRGSDPYFNLDEVLEVERALGVPSTFFFLQQRPIGSALSLADFPNRHGLYDLEDPAVARLVTDLARAGVEIGVHGSYESPRSPGLLRSEIDRLEGLVGTRVVLSRQHYLNYEVWDTALLHEALGLQLDSSLGHTEGTGFRTHSVFPMLPPHPSEDRPLSVLEVPPTLMDVCLPPAEAVGIVDRVIDETAARGGILTAIWHNTSFAKGADPRRAGAYRHLIERAQALGAEFMTGAKLLALAPKLDRGALAPPPPARLGGAAPSETRS